MLYYIESIWLRTRHNLPIRGAKVRLFFQKTPNTRNYFHFQGQKKGIIRYINIIQLQNGALNRTKDTENHPLDTAREKACTLIVC